ncbi:MAG TPA: YbaB/EbfC family nucleoid-associated protein [Dehalococcoidia bacterium]|nr:YbaB/EbfC family nucleoid-associated protein [Dehalococcoidia bacterium]
MNRFSPKDMRKQAQRLQVALSKAQEALEKATVEASAGGGAVTVVMTASGTVQQVKIAPEVVDPEDVALLEDLVTAAVNEALEKSREVQAQSLGSLGLPGL